MPLYEYQCESCAKRFERIQKYSDPLVEICPSCGGPVKKLFSSPSFQFKGSGFYITDYPKKSSTDSSGSTEPASSKSTEDKSASTDKSSSDKSSSDKSSSDRSSSDKNSSDKNSSSTSDSTAKKD